nr:MAG TPA: hypothetical protein [Caudoviricetes sp.]
MALLKIRLGFYSPILFRCPLGLIGLAPSFQTGLALLYPARAWLVRSVSYFVGAYSTIVLNTCKVLLYLISV